MDSILGFPKSQSNKDSIFEVVDQFSKMVQFMANNKANDATQEPKKLVLNSTIVLLVIHKWTIR